MQRYPALVDREGEARMRQEVRRYRKLRQLRADLDQMFAAACASEVPSAAVSVPGALRVCGRLHS